ncbi:IS200/IS605 family transposase [Staphylococcus sp. GDY8P120P]|uniref:IS200/IS605 family transposase n=1 Tax=Staphylococcus sp. GDY8P120P TaxID=2804156 RepID=UPI001AEC378F|nr:IS200/IS605 family transposase [Staphylococcus sp. GDY8P120P]
MRYKGNKYRRTSTTVSLINYHFMSYLRYRRKIFLSKGLDKRFKALVKAISKTNAFKIIAIKTDKDHCHLFINTLLTYSPSDIMAKIKGGTSKILRAAFKEFRFMPSLWTKSYFVSTVGNISIETIKNYVENQRKR